MSLSRQSFVSKFLTGVACVVALTGVVALTQPDGGNAGAPVVVKAPAAPTSMVAATR